MGFTSIVPRVTEEPQTVMKPFIALMMMAAAASAEVTSNSAINSAGNPNVAGSPMANAGFNGNMMSTTFAESRHADTYGAPAAPIVDSYSSPQASAWAADPAPAAAYPYSFTQSKYTTLTYLEYQEPLYRAMSLKIKRDLVEC